tara:strand:+ start:526 stop:678 length:153 start_codon:yes stop_codon:yes gene_type:complete
LVQRQQFLWKMFPELVVTFSAGYTLFAQRMHFSPPPPNVGIASTALVGVR